MVALIATLRFGAGVRLVTQNVDCQNSDRQFLLAFTCPNNDLVASTTQTQSTLTNWWKILFSLLVSSIIMAFNKLFTRWNQFSPQHRSFQRYLRFTEIDWWNAHLSIFYRNRFGFITVLTPVDWLDGYWTPLNSSQVSSTEQIAYSDFSSNSYWPFLYRNISGWWLIRLISNRTTSEQFREGIRPSIKTISLTTGADELH